MPPQLIRLYTLLLPAFLAFGCAYGQDTRLPDWRTIANSNHQPDTVRLLALDSIIYQVYRDRQIDSALLYLNQQYLLAQAAGEEKWMISALQETAKLYNRQGDYASAIPSNRELIAIRRSQKNLKGLSIAHRQLAYALRKIGQYGASLENYQQSLQYADQMGTKGQKYRANTLNSLGSFYLNQEAYEQAQEHYLASLAIYRELDHHSGMSSNFNNLSIVHYRRQEYAQALEYLEQARELKLARGDKEGLGNVYQSYGNIYLDWGRALAAQKAYQEALRYRQEVGAEVDVAASYTQLGKSALALGSPSQALYWCTKACEIADRIGMLQGQLNCHECLYLAHKAQGQDRSALEQHVQFKRIQDSIFNVDNTRQIAQLEAQFKYEEELEKVAAAQLQQQALSNARLQQEKNRRYWLIGLLLVLVVFSYLILRISRQRKRQNDELNIMNKQIAEDRELIRQQAQELSALGDLKAQFFTNISHELRTPLTLITAPLEQLLNDAAIKKPAPLQRRLKGIQANARKLLVLMDELLELARLESGSGTILNNAIHLSLFCQKVITPFEELARQKAIKLVCKTTFDDQLAIWTDDRRLEKILSNLLTNALKFTPEGGDISMTVEVIQDSQAKHQLAVQVTDNGEGIPSEDIPHIFNRFFQSEQNARTGQGTGVGLALAYESAQLLGGHLKVESNWGSGSTFSLTVPVRLAKLDTTPFTTELEPSTTAQVEQNTPADSPVHPLMLIVEDHPEMRHFLEEVLRGDFRCELVENGTQALAFLEKNQVDIILTDLMMPGLDGAELVRQLKENNSFVRIPIIVLSAKKEVAEKVSMLRTGIDDYITKPFSPGELIARAKNLTNNYQLRRALLTEEDGSLAQPSADEQWLQLLERRTTKIILEQKELNTNVLANMMNISKRQLLRRLKELTGLSTQQYILDLKLNYALGLLENRSFRTIAEIAHASGFNTPNYFSKLFFRRYGKRPSEYL